MHTAPNTHLSTMAENREKWVLPRPNPKGGTWVQLRSPQAEFGPINHGYRRYLFIPAAGAYVATLVCEFFSFWKLWLVAARIRVASDVL